MFFFFRKKRIVFDVITSEQHAYDYAKIDRADKHYPDWWKKLPARIDVDDGLYRAATAKKCPGIIDYYRNGIVIPLWSDLNVKLLEQAGSYVYQYSNMRSELTSHGEIQYDNAFDNSRTQHIKLLAPWLGISKKFKFKAVWTDPVYNRVDSLFDASVLPGVIEYGRTPMQLNINLLLKRNKDGKKLIEFKFGDPIVLMVPLTEDIVEVKSHLVSASEYSKYNNGYAQMMFTNTYRTMNKLQEQENQNKCPFRL